MANFVRTAEPKMIGGYMWFTHELENGEADLYDADGYFVARFESMAELEFFVRGADID